MEKRRLAFVFISVLLLALISHSTFANDLQQAQVTRVIDGDTIEVRFPDGKAEKVRHISISSFSCRNGCCMRKTGLTSQ